MTEIGSGAEKKVKMNYPANSHKERDKAAQEERPKVEKVITGEVVQRKKGLGRKVAETFTGDDMSSVGSYILFDVIIPMTKDMVVDALTQGIQRKFYGDTRRSSVRGGSATRHTAYNRMSNGINREDRPSRPMSQRARANHDFDEIVLSERGEAEEVLERLGDLVDNYDVATVSDLYEMVGITGSFTDNKWGWTDLRGAEITRIRGGFLLDLPKPGPLD